MPGRQIEYQERNDQNCMMPFISMVTSSLSLAGNFRVITCLLGLEGVNEIFKRIHQAFLIIKYTFKNMFSIELKPWNFTVAVYLSPCLGANFKHDPRKTPVLTLLARCKQRGKSVQVQSKPSAWLPSCKELGLNGLLQLLLPLLLLILLGRRHS